MSLQIPDLHVGRGIALRNSLIIADQQNGPKLNIVEIGTIRDLKPHAYLGDGYSSLLWAWYAKENPTTKVDLIDVDANSLQNCHRVLTEQLGGLPANVNIHHMTGVDFLKQSSERIDLLYLDGSDDPKEMDDEFEVAEKNQRLHAGAILLLDDIGNPDGNHWPGKGEILVPKLLESATWALVYDDRETKQLLFERII